MSENELQDAINDRPKKVWVRGKSFMLGHVIYVRGDLYDEAIDALKGLIALEDYEYAPAKFSNQVKDRMEKGYPFCPILDDRIEVARRVIEKSW